MGRELSHDDVALVLRRASELDTRLGAPADPGIDEATLEQAAVEAGLSPAAVHRALAELRSGLLDPGGRRHHGLLGEPRLTICRTVPGPVDAVDRHLRRFLAGQLFELRRDRPTTATWVRRRGLEACARRAVDRAVQRRLILREVHHVDLTLAQQGGDWVLVRLDLDVLAIRHHQGRITGSTAAVGGGMMLTTVALSGVSTAFLAAAAAGTGLAAVGYRTGARLYRDRVGEIASGVNGVLDLLERPGRLHSGARHLQP